MQYKSDFNTFDLIKYFAIISIIISCLGLYAMSLFMAEKRYREIGIRKTFGAGVGHIFAMVSSDLSKLIVIAFLLSIPIIWFGMNQWLESFAYKITPGIGVYIIAGFISICIGWLTIGYQSIKAARTNPVDVLKED
jgi:putative ABC transport system permease protein